MAVDKVGQTITKGFYVPGSVSSSYVASKRNDEGSYEYTSQAQDVGLQRQAALQNLNEQYGDVVNNAYASYLANQKVINASAMGQGYKDAYNKAQQEALVSGIAQAGMSAANARQEIDESALKAREQLDEQFALETTSLDKVGTSLDNYFEYLKNLTNDAGQNYLQAIGIDYDENTRAQDIYTQLYNAVPYTTIGEGDEKRAMFTDEEGNIGKSFLDYVSSSIGDKQADTDWRDWLFYRGGWDMYIDALNKSRQEKPAIIKKQEAEEAAKEATKLPEGVVTRATKIQQNAFKPVAYTINGKTYTAGSDGNTVVQARSPESQYIINKLKVKDKINSGDWKVGDVIKIDDYKNRDRFNREYGKSMTKYYIIDSVGDGISFVEINYKE